MKRLLFSVFGVLLCFGNVFAQQWNGASTVSEADREGQTWVGPNYLFPGAFNGSRLMVQKGQIAQVEFGTFGDFSTADNVWAGIGYDGTPAQTAYGLAMARKGRAGFCNLQVSPVAGDLDLVLAFGGIPSGPTPAQRLRIQNILINGPATTTTDLMIFNPNRTVGVNIDPQAAFDVDARVIPATSFPAIVVRNSTPVPTQPAIVEAFSAIGKEGNSVIGNDFALEGFRGQISPTLGGQTGTAVNLQAQFGPIPSGGVIPAGGIKRDELSWQDLGFGGIVSTNTAILPVANAQALAKFFVTFRNNSNNTFNVNNRLDVMTFQGNGRVGINTPQPISLFGAVNVHLDVNGAIRSTNALIVSDGNLKKNVNTIDNAMEIIRKLRGTTYNFKTEEFPEKALPGGKQYGFIAQEMERVLPEAAQKTDDGFYAVNYDAVIPVAVEAIKEQDRVIEEQAQKIDELERQLNELRGMVMEMRNGGNTPGNSLNNSGYSLEQNTPNPFGTETTVRFTMPKEAANASVNVYDLNGKLMKSYRVSGTEGAVTITAAEFPAGIYFYDLLVNGQQKGLKKMVLNGK